jgi:hypothetical protein
VSTPPKKIRYSDSHDIIVPEGHTSCYEFAVTNHRTGAGPYRAFLTYELFPNITEERSLLITSDTGLLHSAAENALFKSFTEALWNTRGNRLTTSKSVVNAIVDGNYDLPNAHVAVHKFGPVPVFVLDKSVKLPVHSRTVDVRIALYPRFEKPRPGEFWTKKRPKCLPGKQEYRQSMTIAPHIVFKRYFEDVAEDFHDLRRLLNIESVYRRAKQTEATLGASVDSKLATFLPKVKLDKTHNEEQREAWTYFLNNASVLYEAAVSHDYALFLLNHVYRVIGIDSHSEEYRIDLMARHQHFATLLGEDRASEIRHSSDVITFIERCLERHDARDLFSHAEYNAAKDLLNGANEAPSPWCAEFAKFAAFAILLHNYDQPGRHVRVFISYHSQVPSSRIIRDQVADYIRSSPKSRTSPLFVSDLPPGTPFKHIIRSAIWCSHGVVAICPANTSTIMSPNEKDYKWIARESEYAKLLKKEILFAIQDGANKARLLEDLANDNIGYLITGSKLMSNELRAKHLVSEYEDSVLSSFSLIHDDPSAKGLDPALAQHLSQFLNNTSVSALYQLLDGYVRQFDLSTQEILIYILDQLGYLGKHPRCWIIAKLATYYANDFKRATRAFEYTRQQIRGRILNIRGKPVSLINQRVDDLRYRENLSAVIRILHPSLRTDEIREWRDSWLAKWRRQFPKLLAHSQVS